MEKLLKTMISYIFAKNKINLWKFMKQISGLIFFIFLIGCSKDNSNDIINPSNCLTNKIAKLTQNDCKAISGSICEHIYIGSKKLSVKSKNLFNDFCFGPKSQIIFKDHNGNQLISIVDEQKYVTSRSAISTNITSTDCKTICLDSEEVVWGIKSERFTLEINLVLIINFDITQEYLDDKIQTSFVIWAEEGNSKQAIFILPIANGENFEIIPDTTYIRLHNTIEINGETFTNVYSNENLNVNGLIRKEKVYFNKTLGLIAVRDSLGTLWRKN
jgi:hypothetical protein